MLADGAWSFIGVVNNEMIVCNVFLRSLLQAVGFNAFVGLNWLWSLRTVVLVLNHPECMIPFVDLRSIGFHVCGHFF